MISFQTKFSINNFKEKYYNNFFYKTLTLWNFRKKNIV